MPSKPTPKKPQAQPAGEPDETALAYYRNMPAESTEGVDVMDFDVFNRLSADEVENLTYFTLRKTRRSDTGEHVPPGSTEKLDHLKAKQIRYLVNITKSVVPLNRKQEPAGETKET